MDRPHYEIDYSYPRKVYLFESVGKHGKVTKIVKFQRIQNDMVNLGFGDCNETGDDFDDLIVTDNGDMEMVLSTVIKIAATFLSTNPDVLVFLTGSTAARTRLYQIIISNSYDIIIRDYEVWGYREGCWHPFEKNVNYEAFLVSKLL